MDAGRLDHKVTFKIRETIETDLGGSRDEWVPQFTEWAGITYLRGTEAVMQARLASKNPVIVAIRNSERARQITSEWLVTVRSRTGITKDYHVKEDPRPSEFDGFLEMLCEG